MNGKQNNLKEELDFICKTQYNGDEKAMMSSLEIGLSLKLIGFKCGKVEVA